MVKPKGRKVAKRMRTNCFPCHMAGSISSQLFHMHRNLSPDHPLACRSPWRRATSASTSTSLIQTPLIQTLSDSDETTPLSDVQELCSICFTFACRSGATASNAKRKATLSPSWFQVTFCGEEVRCSSMALARRATRGGETLLPNILYLGSGAAEELDGKDSQERNGVP